MDSGTGCVHTAPGFGADDYQTCTPLRHGHGRARGRSGPPHRLRRKIRGHARRRVQPRHPGGHEGVRRAVRLRGDRPLAIRTAGAARSPSSSAPPRSGSAPSSPSRTRPCAACDDVRWVPALGHRPHEVHDPRARRLVHLPPAPLGPAHPGVLLQGLRQARLHRRDHRGRLGALWREGLQRLVRDGRRRASCPRASPARTAAASGFDQGDGHAGRLVRLRLHPLRVHAEGSGLLARRRCISRVSTSTAAGSSPRC